MKKTIISLIMFFSALLPCPGLTNGYIVENFRVEDGLSNNTTHALLYDNEGYLWIGCQGYINRYDGIEFKVYDLKSPYKVNKIVQEADGKIIAKCNDIPLYLDRLSDKFVEYGDTSYFKRNKLQIPSLQNATANARIGKWIFGGTQERAIVYDTENGRLLFPDWTIIRSAVRNTDGNIWLATNNGIYVVNDSLEVLSHIVKNTADKYALHDNALNNMVIDRFGGIWVSSYFEGIFHFSPNDGEITRYNNILGATDTRVRSIVEDNDGTLWIGTEDNGLIHYDQQKFTRISLPSRSNNIIRLFFRDDTLWVKTYDPEINYIAIHTPTLDKTIVDSMPDIPGNLEFNLLNSQLSLPDYGKYYACVKDGDNNSWITSSRGLLCVNADSTAFHFFSCTDGLQFDNFNYSSLLYTSDSLLYAGTNEGFISLNPRKMLTQADSVIIKVSGISHEDRTIHIKHDDNTLNINAVTLDFRTPKRTWLQYKVCGLEENWQDVNAGHIILNNLETGRYEIQIRALTGDGNKVIGLWRQNFRILPTPFLSFGAIVIYLALILSVIYISVRIISKNTIMNSKVALAGRLAGEIRHPLALAQIQMETLLENFRHSTDEQTRKDLNELSENMENINRMIDNLSELRSVESVNAFISGTKEVHNVTLPTITSYDATILIMTPSENMFNFFSNILSDNFNLIRANYPAEAIKILDTHKTSLILIDNVAGESGNEGIELCRKIKQSSATAYKPVIILSTDYDITSRIYALSCGADAFLVKPLSRDVLFATICNLLNNRSAIRKHYSENPAVNSVQLENTSPDNVLMKNIHDFIVKNLAKDDLRVNDVALANHVSLSNLQKKMKSVLNVTPAQYILGLRLKKAEELLKDKTLSIEEISQMTGFTSHSYFTSCFRKHYNCTPMQYRDK